MCPKKCALRSPHNILNILDWKNINVPHLTYKLLPHYLGKCKTVTFQLYSTMISIKTATF